jgi:hypothetical protein
MRTHIKFGYWFVGVRLGARKWRNAGWHLHDVCYCFFSDCHSSGEFVTNGQVVRIGTVCE